MNKSDILKILEQIPDDVDIVFLDEDGNYRDALRLIEVETLGRFRTGGEEFYEKYRPLWVNWEFLYDRKCAILG